MVAPRIVSFPDMIAKEEARELGVEINKALFNFLEEKYPKIMEAKREALIAALSLNSCCLALVMALNTTIEDKMATLADITSVTLDTINELKRLKQQQLEQQKEKESPPQS